MDEAMAAAAGGAAGGAAAPGIGPPTASGAVGEEHAEATTMRQVNATRATDVDMARHSASRAPAKSVHLLRNGGMMAARPLVRL